MEDLRELYSLRMCVCNFYVSLRSFPCGSDGKESACNSGDVSSIPGSGRSLEKGEAQILPLQYSCLGDSMDRGAWRATVHAIAESQT